MILDVVVGGSGKWVLENHVRRQCEMCIRDREWNVNEMFTNVFVGSVKRVLSCIQRGCSEGSVMYSEGVLRGVCHAFRGGAQRGLSCIQRVCSEGLSSIHI